MSEHGDILWRPDEKRISDSLMDRFRRARKPELSDSTELQEWSVAHSDEFWELAWPACGVIGERGSGPAVAVDAGLGIGGSRFFPNAQLSYAENLLAGGDREGARDSAIVYRREDGLRREMTWQQLRREVSRVTAWLRSLSVGPGDCVAAWMPNLPETVVTMLATNAVGAIFTSTSPDFGVAGVLDRFSQVGPKVLLVSDGYVYAGKSHARLPLLGSVVAGLPKLKAVAVVGELETSPDLPEVAGIEIVDYSAVGDGRREVETVSESETAMEAGSEVEPVDFRRVPMSEPGFVLYSSGTTGKPKCIAHSAGGVLLKQLTEHQFHCDIRPGDTVFYYTTCGWMMWNWLVTTLASGATIVLYEGSPFHPGPDAMWNLAAEESVTLFGTSAKFIDASAKAGARPRESHDLSALRTITSTGSPLSAEGFAFIYSDVKPDVHLASISGGTDICGCFVIGDPTRPVYAGEIQGPALATAVDVWDESGRSLRGKPGERGELVCTQAIPSMPLHFVDDPDGSRYRSAYFDRFPGVWAQGDFASWTEHGGLVIHGRSDATLNAGGVRIGTAEIYRQVEQIPEIVESLAIGQESEGDTRIVLFVRLGTGAVEVSDDLGNRIRARLRAECSPRHVPARIAAVADLPRTRSGKLAELAVSDVVHGRPVRNAEALANPEALSLFENLTVLQD